MIAGNDRLHAGGKYKLAFGTDNIALPADYDEDDAVGVVNPFPGNEILWSLKQGDEFWGLLMPGLVTGMTHHWQCPLFDSPKSAKNNHEEWIRAFCDRWNFNYDDLIEESTAKAGGDWDHYIAALGRDLHSRGELGDDHDLFWMHLEALTGNKFNDDHREKFGWSCSC